MSSEIEVFAELIHETNEAYLIEPPGRSRVWVPKSQCSYDGKATFTMSEWIAEKKDLL